jgi:hypothetical protein
LNTKHKTPRRVFAFSVIRILFRDQPGAKPKGFAAFALQKQAAGRQVRRENITIGDKKQKCYIQTLQIVSV